MQDSSHVSADWLACRSRPSVSAAVCWQAWLAPKSLALWQSLASLVAISAQKLVSGCPLQVHIKRALAPAQPTEAS